MKKKPDSSPISDLRRQAEAKLIERKKNAAALPATGSDPGRLVHELEVHQIEVEMQNEELVQSRAQVEAGLRRYTDLYDLAPVGYFLLARDGAIHQVNQAGASLLGVERSALIERRFGVFVSVESRVIFNAFLEKTFSMGGSKEICEVALQKDGNGPLWAHINATFIKDGQECLAMVSDITLSKRTGEALREANGRLQSEIVQRGRMEDELRRGLEGAERSRHALLSVLEDRKQAEEAQQHLLVELTQKNSEMEQLIYVASHDLRSPLVNVQGFSKELGLLVNELAEIMSHAGLPEKQQARTSAIVLKEFPEARNYILASVVKMDGLLKGLLKFSRLGRACVNLQKINMDDMLSGVLKTMEFLVQHCGARIEKTALPPCIGDPVLVDQMFTNLIDNAIKYLGTDRPGVIRITGKPEKGFSGYCVEDNGIGIAPEHQQKVFDIFHRLDPQASEGEGLGLAIVKKILSRLGGSVRLESEAGKGSRFFVSLPGA